ncbi:predicted protein [Nematostella vectensis]|uniref:G-protein coupled receptors family 1 profile domain-containing protein n=1 Tax=Nematostella vectensis TaxID=45351 RepID=A7S5Z7_NEMVE|nr:predicted protein [Nematostella vectensis]|eukprot:XP_001632956.1 predicted protein [Nematostella vectensis]
MAELRRKVVLNPFRPKPSSRSIKLVLCGLWLLALGMSCPVGLVIQASSDQCYEQWPSPILNQVYTVGLTVAVYIVPIALLINAYTRIVLYTKKHAQGMRNMRVTRARDDREVMKASLIIMAIYTILTLPNHLGWLLRVFNVRIANKLILYSWPLVNVQSMCDPFIYGVIMARFRRGFARYFSFGLWRHRMRLAPANPSNMSIQGPAPLLPKPADEDDEGSGNEESTETPGGTSPKETNITTDKSPSSSPKKTRPKSNKQKKKSGKKTKTN